MSGNLKNDVESLAAEFNRRLTTLEQKHDVRIYIHRERYSKDTPISGIECTVEFNIENIPDVSKAA